MRGEPALDHGALALGADRRGRTGGQGARTVAIAPGLPQGACQRELRARTVVGRQGAIELEGTLEQRQRRARIAQSEPGLAETGEIVRDLGVVGAEPGLVDGARACAYPQRIVEPLAQ